MDLLFWVAGYIDILAIDVSLCPHINDLPSSIDDPALKSFNVPDAYARVPATQGLGSFFVRGVSAIVIGDVAYRYCERLFFMRLLL